LDQSGDSYKCISTLTIISFKHIHIFLISTVKGVCLGFGRQLYFHCFLTYMVICAFESPSSIPSFLATQIAYIRYGQFKKMTPLSFYLYITLLLVFLKVCYYYMLVPTTYHWNISFQKQLSSKYVVKNVWQTFVS
jgi:hypothetical protein